tara:strand:- start:455 stop:685 length:231 start_codon:yes stop_codon:yes gene_type:complete
MMIKNLKLTSIRSEPNKYLKVSEINNSNELTLTNLATMLVVSFLLKINLLNINNLTDSVEIIAKIIEVSRLIPKYK